MSTALALVLLAGASATVPPCRAQETALPDFILTRAFVFEDAPFPSAHASTIVETAPGELLVAWFGGTSEGDDDVEIWLSRKSGAQDWTSPAVMTDYPEMPTWNPVLFHHEGTTWLYFKIGPSPREWIGAYRTSDDGGRTWSEVTYLPAGLTGPIRAKPVVLSDGTILAGTSFEAGYRGGTPLDAPYRSWASWVERSTDGGRTWTKHGPIALPDVPYGVIQPTIWETDAGEVRMLMRSARIGRLSEAVSDDGGVTWSEARPTDLPNPSVGVDVVRLRDGRLFLIYNHTERGRTPIHLAVSDDEGTTWSEPYVLEDGEGEFSYPAVVQTADGLVHVTYTWRRQLIRHLVIDPDRLPDQDSPR